MNKMKKIWFKSAFLAMVGMSMTSCGDFLDIYPWCMKIIIGMRRTMWTR